MPTQVRFDRDLFDNFKVLYEGGKGTYEIARMFGKSFSYVACMLKCGGVKIRSRSDRALNCKGMVGIARKDEIVDLYKDGKTIEKITKYISEKYDKISASGVRNVIIRGGVKLIKRHKPTCIPEDKINEAIKMYNSGKTYEELGKIFKVDKTSVCNILKSRGVKSRPISWARIKDENDKAEIRESYKKGISRSFLAMKFDCSGDAIKKVLRDSGIPVRSFDEAVGIKWFDKQGRQFWLKSTWEVKFAEWLDKKNYEWNYEVEKYKLYYGMNYTPDFWIYRKGVFNKLIDVKGWWRPTSRKRIKMFRTIYKDIRLFVFMGRHFKKLGIDLKIS